MAPVATYITRHSNDLGVNSVEMFCVIYLVRFHWFICIYGKYLMFISKVIFKVTFKSNNIHVRSARLTSKLTEPL